MAGSNVTLNRTAYVAPSESTLVDINVDDDLSPAIDIRGAAFGGLIIPDTHNGTSIAFLVAATADGPFAALPASTNLTVVSATLAAWPLPAELFGFCYFKISPGQQSTTNTQYIVTLRP
jgi:hypothetical protein